jgi:hypothetical protein
MSSSSSGGGGGSCSSRKEEEKQKQNKGEIIVPLLNLNIPPPIITFDNLSISIIKKKQTTTRSFREEREKKRLYLLFSFHPRSITRLRLRSTSLAATVPSFSMARRSFSSSICATPPRTFLLMCSATERCWSSSLTLSMSLSSPISKFV